MARMVPGGLFELRPDLLSGHNQLGHHGGVKNVFALRHGANSLAALCGFLSPGNALVVTRDLC